MKKTLLFLHIGKTAGAALTGTLWNRFRPEAALPLYFGPEPDYRDIDRFDYVSGHVSISFLERFRQAPFVFTILRDPIERAISAYYFARSIPADYKPTVMQLDRGPEATERIARFIALAREHSIGELIERDPDIARETMGDRQARVLGGSDPGGGGERLDDAIAGLERCDFVGLTERLDESADWLARRLGWRDLGPVPRSNVTAVRRRREQLSGGEMEALMELTSVDRELYDLAVRHYEGQVSDWGERADPRDPSTEVPDAAPVSDLSFDAPIPGAGWLRRERHEDGTTFCWIGSANRAWVDLAIDGGADSLVVEIPHAIDQPVLESLRISVDGEGVHHTLAESDGAVVATAPLKGRPLAGDQRTLRVTLETDRAVRPREVDPSSSDERELSIAVRRIALRRS
jgi:hypothetical protein